MSRLSNNANKIEFKSLVSICLFIFHLPFPLKLIFIYVPTHYILVLVYAVYL